MSNPSTWSSTLITPCVAAVLALLFAAATAAGAGEAVDAVEFNRHIRPLLSDNCYACHGPDARQRKAKLRLDTQDGLVAQRDLPLIAPGKPQQSELYLRLVTEDEDERMPQKKSGKVLSAEQIELVRRWIEQGAPWEGHWAFIAPRRIAPPPVSHGDFIRNDIDRYILARQEKRGLSPSPRAERVTLIRRLSFDLTGLPPAAAEVEAFVRDESPDAYEKLVDRLMSSPAYGERMAMYWLDVVRYADSNGYHSDEPRQSSPYRDYVIAAFNDNKPFDQFVIEQLAGDLLPDATVEQRVASGFNMLLQTTNEGGAQPREYLAKYLADRVRNVGTILLGVTTGCAECHDHKFDPFTAKDFYSLGAFFADIREEGKGNPPTHPVPTPALKQQRDQLESELAALRAAAASPGEQQLTAMHAWEQQQRARLAANERVDFAWFDDKNIPKGDKQGAWHYVDAEKGPVFSGQFSRQQSGNEIVQHFVQGAKDAIKLAEGEMFFAYVWLDPKNPPKQVMLQFNDGSWEHRVYWGEDRISFGGIGTDSAAHRKAGDLPQHGQWVRLQATLEQVGLKPGSVINGMAFTQFGGLAYWDKAGVVRSGIGAPEDVVAALTTDAAQRSAPQTAKLREFFFEHSDAAAPWRAQRAALEEKKKKLDEAMPRTLMTIAGNPRPIRILPRGNWMDDSGAIVEPAIPEFLGSLDISDRRANRLDLAKWITGPDNPLTARTFVNRLWMLHFGAGLSVRLDDLGAQGDWPTHPQLLDYLATEFVNSGWDVKHIVKLIVMSGVYQQSSQDSELLRSRDPLNRYYARQSRWRLDAEMVRDNALAISGLLVREVGGPSVKPYQPAGYWRHMNFPVREWQQDSGADLYRRGLYTWWQRMFLHPSLLAFDAPSREESCVQRSRSNTPQQALASLNDPTYVEAARVFAQRMVKEGGADAAARLDFAFRQAVSRPVTTDEADLLTGLLEKHLAHYRGDVEAAKQMIGTGASVAPAELDPAELAAWTSIARIILNMHETITRY